MIVTYSPRTVLLPELYTRTLAVVLVTFQSDTLMSAASSKATEGIMKGLYPVEAKVKLASWKAFPPIVCGPDSIV